MKKTLMLLTVFCLVSMLPGLVFCAPFLVCDPATGAAPDNYKVEITGPLNVTQDVAPDTTGTYGFKLDLSPLNLPDGSYTVKASASNMWGTSDWSVEFPFVKSVSGVPANIRLVPNL